MQVAVARFGRAASQRLQLAARGLGAALGREHEQAERVAPALLDVRAERRHRREPQRGFGVAGLRGVEQQARAVLGQQRPLVADDEPFAELGHRVEVAGLRGACQRVDGVVVAAREIVLGGQGQGGVHCKKPRTNASATDKPRATAGLREGQSAVAGAGIVTSTYGPPTGIPPIMSTLMNAIPEAPRPTFAELFTPKLVTVFREGYEWQHLRADALAGLTVAIVALPLSMAIAIASGAAPAQGLYAAIIGGFMVSALGGSRFQIGGPAGAFIVLVAATAQAHGLDGLLLATMLAGLMLAAIGFLQARHLHQVHPLSRDGRFHGRHRRHHPREPAQGSARAHARGAGARRAARQAAGALALSADVRRHDDRGVARDDRRHRRPETLAAALARHADRGRGRRCRHGAAPSSTS